MHNELLKEASQDTLRSFLKKAFDELKVKDYEMYKELELELYKKMYGCHFNSWLLDKALSSMENEDGTIGMHWSLEQTSQVARDNNISFNNYNEYDWCFVMNMMYSDYYHIFDNDTTMYVKISKAFLEDKDSKKGKAFTYYMEIKN